MNPIHTKAAYWLQKGLFDDLKSFADFESRIDVVVEEKDRCNAGQRPDFSFKKGNGSPEQYGAISSHAPNE